MNAHRGIPGTVRLALVLNTALTMWHPSTDVGHDARTGGAFFRVTWAGRPYTVRVTEVDE